MIMKTRLIAKISHILKYIKIDNRFNNVLECNNIAEYYCFYCMKRLLSKILYCLQKKKKNGINGIIDPIGYELHIGTFERHS